MSHPMMNRAHRLMQVRNRSPETGCAYRSLFVNSMRMMLVFLVIVWSSHALADAHDAVGRAQLYDDAMAYVLTPECTQNEAISKFTAVIKADPSHPANDLVLLAIANLLRNGDLCHGRQYPASAVWVCETIVQKFPPTSKPVILAHITIGDIYFASGRRAEAREAYERLLGMDTSGPEWEEVRPWLEEQLAALAPALAATAVVRGAAADSLLRLGDLRHAHADRPAIVSVIDRITEGLKRQMVDPVARDRVRQLMTTAEAPDPIGAEGPSEASLPGLGPVTSSMPADAPWSPHTVHEPLASGAADEEPRVRVWIGIGLIAIGLVAGVLVAVVHLAGSACTRGAAEHPLARRKEVDRTKRKGMHRLW